MGAAIQAKTDLAATTMAETGAKRRIQINARTTKLIATAFRASILLDRATAMAV
jgi:hypothetical protein